MDRLLGQGPPPYGVVKVDVLEVRQDELDQPSDDPGDRLHAAAHAWANDTATEITTEVRPKRSSTAMTRLFRCALLDDAAVLTV